MKILSIGNSFSQDTTRYLYGIARADGIELKVVNLYIGGCDLAKHYCNMMSEKEAYSYEIDGIKSGLYVSLKQALLSDAWDYITIQQQSLQSASYETFVPYLGELVAYVRKMDPKAKILMHQTWGYEENSEKLQKSPYDTHQAMFLDIKTTYSKAAEEIGAVGIIPSGEAVSVASRQGRTDIHRDGFHLSLGFGRYMCGLVWYKALTGKDVLSNTFRDFDEEISEDDVLAAKQIATMVF